MRRRQDGIRCGRTRASETPAGSSSRNQTLRMPSSCSESWVIRVAQQRGLAPALLQLRVVPAHEQLGIIEGDMVRALHGSPILDISLQVVAQLAHRVQPRVIRGPLLHQPLVLPLHLEVVSGLTARVARAVVPKGGIWGPGERNVPVLVPM